MICYRFIRDTLDIDFSVLPDNLRLSAFIGGSIFSIRVSSAAKEIL